MLNKELLRGGSDKLYPVDENDYTHIVTVGTVKTGGRSYGYIGSAGSISPTLYSDDIPYSIIQRLSCNTFGEINISCALEWRDMLNRKHLYLYRSDNHKLYLNCFPPDNFTIMEPSLAGLLFTPDELGKEIPVWLSTEMPPWT